METEILLRRIAALERDISGLKSQELNRVSRLNVGLAGAAVGANDVMIDGNLIIGNVATYNAILSHLNASPNAILLIDGLGGDGWVGKIDLRVSANGGALASVLALTPGKAIVDGYTQLGSGAPPIKAKKLTGTTGASQGDAVSIAHGVTATKIIGWIASVWHATNGAMPPEFHFYAGYQYSCYLSGVTNFDVVNSASNSASILSKPITILLFYEE